MKIGIVSSSYEALPLFSFLHKHDHEYHLFCDWAHSPRANKSRNLVAERFQFACKSLQDSGVDMIIAPPVDELLHTGKNEHILPLFETYLREHCLQYSIVGKLGILCAYTDMEPVEELIQKLSKEHQLTDYQQNIKKFHTDFPVWKKDVSAWIDFLGTFGKRDPLVRKAIKHDLRYFKDADVDTLIPMNRGFFQYEKMIQMRANKKRLRLHGLNVVEQCFAQLTTDQSASDYSVTLHTTDSGIAQILNNKKWSTLLSRGGKSKVTTVLID